LKRRGLWWKREPSVNLQSSLLSSVKMPPTRYVAIAEIARPHGVQGELRVKVYNEHSTVLAKGRMVLLLFAPPHPAGVSTGPRMGRKESERPDPRPTKITSVREGAGALLIRLEGVADRDAADALRGAQIAVERDELPELADGEFYACDIEGARVELTNGDVIGKVLALESYPTCNVLRVALDEGRIIEVPLVDSYVALVDAEAHLVKLHHIGEL
jgi:16S rRNA processing protein RimM